ncbi:MAG TPA: hypothetical protein VGG13_03955 [Candidatus Saccharimonadales bacterium]|jgi:hypothetical protein
MKFPHKRRLHEDEAAGRRRPMRSEQGQNRVFSYYAARSANETNVGRELPQDDDVSKRRGRSSRTLRRRALLLVAGVIVLGALSSQLRLNTEPKIVVVSNTGGKVFLQSTAAYRQAAAVLFKKSFGNRNKLTVNVAGISSALEAQFPELSDVSVALPIVGNQPVVYIQPSDPSFVLATRSGRFVLDGTGRALVAVGSVPQLAAFHVPTVTDESGLQPHLGETALPSNNVSFIQTMVAQLDAQHFSVRRIVLPPAASEVDAYIAGKPYFVKFNLEDQSGALQQAGTFVAVARRLAARGKTPARYIDVRIDGRAYYK